MNKTMKMITILAIAMAAFALTGTVAAFDDWQQLQKNETKYGISSAEAIVGPGGPVVAWNTRIGDFYASPIAHGGFVYANNRFGLHKYYYNGTIAPGGWPSNNPVGAPWPYGSAAYGNGTGRIFSHAKNSTAYDNGKVIGVNESDPTDVWSINPPATSGSWATFKSEITYAINGSGGKSIYFGDTGDRLFCIDVGGTDFVPRWTYVGAGAQGWAGASVIGDYVVFGNDSGWVTCLNESDGAFVDAIHTTHGKIWSSISGSNGYIFFTSYNGFLSKVEFNTTTGQFGVATGVVIPGASTTPVIYNNRVYASYNSGVRCINESNLSQMWWDHPIPSTFSLIASPALAIRNGSVYIYVTMNDVPGGVICINDTGLEGVQEWRDYEVGIYSMQGVAIADDETGTWIFATTQGGGGKLAGHWQKDPPPLKPNLNVTAIETSAIYAGTYNIVKATIKNVGNASVEGFNATLAAGTTVVDMESVASLGAGESTVVKFVWTPTATGATTLNVTADSGCVVSEWDETNNSMTKVVTVDSIPATDLAVIEVNSCDLANDTENTVFAVIENKGADASGFDVTLLNGTEVVDTVFVPMLHFRDSQLVAFNWTPTTAGTANLNVTIEDGGYNNTTQVNVVTPVIVSESASIQSAIGNAGASNLTIIRVESGTYNETVTLPAGKLVRLVANASDVVICNDTGDIVTIEGTCCYVDGFTINGSGFNASGMWPGYGGSCINVTSEWNVVKNNHIYNRSGGIKLYGEKNLIRCNTVGDSANDKVCLCQMAISGDCNAIVKNTFDGDTAAHATYSWILGGTFTDAGVTKDVDAFNNTVRGNDFTMTGGAGWAPGDILFGGDPNMVFDNIINDTGSNVVELGELNWYNVTKVAVEDPTMGNVVHGPYYGGNYWLNYTGSDSDQDLLGDTGVPYLGVDGCPLVRALCGDVDCSGAVDVDDLTAVNNKIAATTPLNCEWAGDVDLCSGAVDVDDLTAINNKVAATTPLPGCCVGCCPL